MTLATGQVINQAIDLLFIGLPGVAKTHLAQAIGSGFSVERSWSWVADEPVEVPVEVHFGNVVSATPRKETGGSTLKLTVLCGFAKGFSASGC